MIYAYDLNIQMPTKDLYDTQIMAMAISAAKDMYEKGQKALDDFNKTYGDFITPISKDQLWYNKNIVDPIQKTVEDLYNLGIDPLRTAEGRARIQRMINRVPTSTINMMKANAALYEKRLAQEAELGSKYNRDMDIAILGEDPTQFSTVGPDGKTLRSFNYAPPSEYKTADQLLFPIFENVKPIYDPERTKRANDGMLHNTVTKERLMLALNDSKEDLLNTPSGRYLQILAEKEASRRRANGDNVTANDVFNKWAQDRLSTFIRDDVQADPVYAENLRYQHQRSLNKQQHDFKVSEWLDPRNPANKDKDPKPDFNYLSELKLAGLRKMAGVKNNEDIPSNISKGQKALIMQFAIHNGFYNPNYNKKDPKSTKFTRDITNEEAIKFLEQTAVRDNPANFRRYLGNRKPVDDSETMFLMNPSDFNKLENPKRYVNGYVGMPGGDSKQTSNLNLDPNKKYIMTYDGYSNVRRSQRNLDQSILIRYYEAKEELDSQGKTIWRPDYSKQHTAVMKIGKSPTLRTTTDADVLSYDDDSQGYITYTSTLIGRDLNQSPIYTQLSNDVFEGDNGQYYYQSE